MAKAHVKKATEHGKFMVMSAYIDDSPEALPPDGKPKIRLNVDGHYWPMGDYQILLDMIEDDFLKRQKRAVIEAAKKQG